MPSGFSFRGHIMKQEKTYMGIEGSEEYVKPSKWWIMDALGRRVYIYKRTRWEAQEIIDAYYGKNHYKVNQA